MAVFAGRSAARRQRADERQQDAEERGVRLADLGAPERDDAPDNDRGRGDDRDSRAQARAQEEAEHLGAPTEDRRDANRGAERELGPNERHQRDRVLEHQGLDPNPSLDRFSKAMDSQGSPLAHRSRDVMGADERADLERRHQQHLEKDGARWYEQNRRDATEWAEKDRGGDQPEPDAARAERDAPSPDRQDAAPGADDDRPATSTTADHETAEARSAEQPAAQSAEPPAQDRQEAPERDDDENSISP